MLAEQTTLIMLMAGNGQRFVDKGYSEPKPFIDVRGKPMFSLSLDCLNLTFKRHIFVVKKQHDIKGRIQRLYPGSDVIELSTGTEGAACTALLTEFMVDKDDSIMFTNCDQYVTLSADKFKASIENADVICTVFEEQSRNNKWSYAEVHGNYITRVAEKNPISNIATCGQYWWKRASDFYSSARDMIKNGDRVNNEYYLCPVINYSIKRGLRAAPVFVDEMAGLGTPEDLEQWLKL